MLSHCQQIRSEDLVCWSILSSFQRAGAGRVLVFCRREEKVPERGFSCQSKALLNNRFGAFDVPRSRMLLAARAGRKLDQAITSQPFFFLPHPFFRKAAKRRIFRSRGREGKAILGSRVNPVFRPSEFFFGVCDARGSSCRGAEEKTRSDVRESTLLWQFFPTFFASMRKRVVGGRRRGVWRLASRPWGARTVWIFGATSSG